MRDYEKIKSICPDGYELLMAALKDAPADGRVELSDGAYAVVSTYEAKPRAEKKFEAHRKFIDVQIVLSGRELIAVESLDTMREGKCLREYDAAADVELYGSNPNGTDYLLEAGDFLILSPEEAHMPGILLGGGSATVRKVVIKIPVR